MGEMKPAHNHERGAYPWVLCTPDCPAWATAMCACSHHWSVHAASGRTARDMVCHAWTGSATPGPYGPCHCRGFAQWAGPTDSRTGEPVRPIVLSTTAVPVVATAGNDPARGFLLDPDDFYEVTCPDCGEDVTISSGAVFQVRRA